MRYPRRFPTLPALLAMCIPGLIAPAQSAPPALLPMLHAGAHDFDPLLGSFTYRLRRIPHPLVGPTAWTDMTGSGACYKVWNGRAQLDTLEADGSSTHIEGLTLRLYDPASRQWRLYWTNSRIGRLDPPQIGTFIGDHGDFYTTDTISGKTVLIRYDWSRLASGTPHFEQAFSSDGGHTWDVNWITDQSRTGDAEWGQPQTSPSAATPASGANDAQHGFDFDFGTWKTHIRRLAHPLTGSSEWIEMNGATATNKIWDGRANLATIEASGPSGHLEFLALRLYDPEAHQWNISFGTSDTGILGVPRVGAFHDGRGEFYASELYRGRNILVRYSIWPVSSNEVRSEQAYSADGGTTWETNFTADFTRTTPTTLSAALRAKR